MPITIIKKTQPVAPAAIVPPAPVAEAPVKKAAPPAAPKEAYQHPPMTDAQRLAYWKGQHPAIGAKPSLCPFCEQMYIVVCNAKHAADCANYAYKQSKDAAKKV